MRWDEEGRGEGELYNAESDLHSHLAPFLYLDGGFRISLGQYCYLFKPVQLAHCLVGDGGSTSSRYSAPSF